MGRRSAVRGSVLALAIALAGSPQPSAAIAPALLMMIKQMAQQSMMSMVKGTLTSSLGGLGCKGMALQNALAGAPLGGGRGLMPGMAMRLSPFGADLPPEMTARLGALMPRMPAGGTLPAGASPDMAAAMARMQQAMAQPLSPAETLATLDELSELGMLPASMRTELTECMTQIPSAGPAIGMGMSMLKPMIPQMRQAREQLYALSPQEQDDVAAQLVQQLNEQPADQRGDLLEVMDSGFFPPRISAAVRAKLPAR